MCVWTLCSHKTVAHDSRDCPDVNLAQLSTIDKGILGQATLAYKRYHANHQLYYVLLAEIAYYVLAFTCDVVIVIFLRAVTWPLLLCLN